MATSIEQEARDMLEEMGVEGAQEFSAGDLVPLTNLINASKTPKFRLNLNSPGLQFHVRDGNTGDIIMCGVGKDGIINFPPRPNSTHGPHLTIDDVKRIVRKMLGVNKSILLGDSESEGDSHATRP